MTMPWETTSEDGEDQLRPLQKTDGITLNITPNIRPAIFEEAWENCRKRRTSESDAITTDQPNIKREKNAHEVTALSSATLQSTTDLVNPLKVVKQEILHENAAVERIAASRTRVLPILDEGLTATSENPQLDDPAILLNPSKTIVAISRKSSKVGSNTVKTLHTRNQALRDFVLKHILKKDANKHAVDFLSLVFNNYSSNYNISETTRRTEISQLRKKLDMLELSPQAKSHEVLLCYFTDDGFFTNIAGIYDFFRVYVNVPITMMVFDGGQRYALHPMKDILTAISDVKKTNLEPSNCHQILVLKWVGISVSKELIASSVRDLRRMLPDRRNGLRIDLDDCSSIKPGEEARKDDKIIRPGKKTNVYRHAVHQGPNGGFVCPCGSCTVTVPSIELLHQHVYEHCRRAQECVLCLPQLSSTPWPGTRNWMDHIQRHLPPTYFCNVRECDKIFFTKGDLTQHMESHDKSRVVTCEQCGSEINRAFMKQHLADHCPARNKNKDNTYKCSYCGETFNDNPQLYKHYRKAHKRRDEILGIAEDAGLLAAGIPGLGFAASASIQDSVSMHLARKQNSTHQQSASMEIFEHEKMNGLKTGNALRSLRLDT